MAHDASFLPEHAPVAKCAAHRPPLRYAIPETRLISSVTIAINASVAVLNGR